MTPAVEAAGLTRRFGRRIAVAGVDLRLDGGVIGLLGPNGSGKTTLLRMLATVLAPTDGALRVLGLDPRRSGERTEIRRRLGYLPQDPVLYDGFTAYDVVDYVAVLKELADPERRRDEVRRVLDAVDLADDMHRRVRALSGGTRQRVAIACALLGRPNLLVLDEPATGLDPEQRLRLRALVSDHGRTGTVLLSTHQTAEVAAYCQRVLVLLDGTVRFDGTPEGLAELARGRVWAGHSDRPGDHSWLTADGHPRAVGDPPPGAEILDPTIDDGYLLLVRGAGTTR